MIERLTKFPSLQELGDEGRALLADSLERRELRPGEVLFHVGDEAAAMFFVVEGVLRIELGGEVLSEVRAGDTLGGASLVCIGNRQCSVRAADPVVVAVLSREAYLRLSGEAPEAALCLQSAVMRELTGSVRALLSAR